MSTVEKTPLIDAQAKADSEAFEQLYVEGKPYPPDLVQRIQERAARVSEEIFRRVGLIDVDQLIQEARDER